MHLVRLALPLSLLLTLPAAARLMPSLPDAPSTSLLAPAAPDPDPDNFVPSPAFDLAPPQELVSTSYDPATYLPDLQAATSTGSQTVHQGDPASKRPADLDANGNPIPLDRRQPQRILGFMPNFRSVSGGAVPHPPGWKYNFTVATRQAFDYSSFLFLGLTSISAQSLDEHPSLGKGIPGFYAYTWRGFLDKTDGTYLQAWLLPSLLHEDTRYYALGHGTVLQRSLYVISRQAVTRTYGGRDTPNLAGLGGKVLTQVISREYYPTGSTDFAALAEKFGYATMRDIGFSAIREFYPSVAAHYVRKHHEKMAARAAATQTTTPVTPLAR